MKRKTKKQLEQEILELKQDIYYLVSNKAELESKILVKMKWKMIFDINDCMWNGESIMLHKPNL